MQLIDNDALDWMHFVGDESFDYPIDYWAAILNSRPDAYCHFHRHLVETTTTVLQGEHHLVDIENGRLFEILDKDENVLQLATIDDFASGQFASAA